MNKVRKGRREDRTGEKCIEHLMLKEKQGLSDKTSPRDPWSRNSHTETANTLLQMLS